MLNRLKRTLLCTLCLMASVVSTAYATRVFGTAKEYANSELIFYRYQDRITYIKEEVFRLKMDEEGNFEAAFGIDRTTYIFAEFGIYYVYFYAEPDCNYEIILPEYVDKSDGDLFNPYFQPTEMQLGIKGMKNTDLNYLIMDFDYYYNRYFDLKLDELYIKGLQSDVDTFINNINARYKKYNNQYFQQYRRYRIAALKNMVTKSEYESALVYSYYSNKDILYDNPAYMDLFNSIYHNYFDNYLVSPGGADLYRVITYGHSISLLHRLIGSDPKHKRKQFRELGLILNRPSKSEVPPVTTFPFSSIETFANGIGSSVAASTMVPFKVPDWANNPTLAKSVKINNCILRNIIKFYLLTTYIFPNKMGLQNYYTFSFLNNFFAFFF